MWGPRPHQDASLAPVGVLRASCADEKLRTRFSFVRSFWEKASWQSAADAQLRTPYCDVRNWAVWVSRAPATLAPGRAARGTPDRGWRKKRKDSWTSIDARASVGEGSRRARTRWAATERADALANRAIGRRSRCGMSQMPGREPRLQEPGAIFWHSPYGEVGFWRHAARADHARVCLRIAPRHGVSHVVDKLKGRGAMAPHERHPEWRRIAGRDRALWARGRYASKRPERADSPRVHPAPGGWQQDRAGFASVRGLDDNSRPPVAAMPPVQ